MPIELRIDWPALHSAFQMNMPEIKCFMCKRTGTVLKLRSADSEFEEVSQSTEYALIEAVPSRIQYTWVDEFVKQVEESEFKEKLVTAINGRGAFRRFKDALLASPEHRRGWFEFRDEKMRVRVTEWVSEQGIVAQNLPPWVEGADQDSPSAVGELRGFLTHWSKDKNLNWDDDLVAKLTRALENTFDIVKKN